MALEQVRLGEISKAIREAKEAPDVETKLNKALDALSVIAEHLGKQQQERDKPRPNTGRSIDW